MEPIGGYFGLEQKGGGQGFHTTPYATKSGRASLHVIMNYVKPKKVYVPYYTCDTMLEPLISKGIEYVFYELDEHLDPVELPELENESYFLYVNYLDEKRATVALLSEKYGDHLIADCTQAYYMKGNGKSWFFNSCRKFFGVPDGSWLYAPDGVAPGMPAKRNTDYETNHLIKRMNGDANGGYEYFRANEILAGKGISLMSDFTVDILNHVDHEGIAAKRLANYGYLHSRLQSLNKWPLAQGNGVPMCYPLLTKRAIDKSVLYSENIFIPVFWREVLERSAEGYEFEKDLTQCLWPLPIDHRYSESDMERLCVAIKNILK